MDNRFNWDSLPLADAVDGRLDVDEPSTDDDDVPELMDTEDSMFLGFTRITPIPNFEVRSRISAMSPCLEHTVIEPNGTESFWSRRRL